MNTSKHSCRDPRRFAARDAIFFPLWAGMALLAACGGGGGGGGPPPNVSAGADRVVTERDTVRLMGSATATTGTVTGWQWSQVSGTPVTLDDATTSTASFVASDVSADEALVFRLVAATDAGGRASDEVTVTVRDVLDAGGVVAFSADALVDGQFEVYVADTRGIDPPRRISGGVQHSSAATVTAIAQSPDGRHVAYIADHRQNEVYEVFIANTDGTGATIAHPALQSGELVTRDSLRWSPVPIGGAHRLAFVAEMAGGIIAQELWTVEPGSSVPVRVSSESPATLSRIIALEWAPDASRIAYVSDAESVTRMHLWTALPSSAAGTIQVSDPMISAGDVVSFEWSPRSDKLAYVADQAVNERFDLYVASAMSRGGLRVSQPMTGTSRVLNGSMAWSPDAGASPLRIAYITNVRNGTQFELYTTTEDGTDGASGSGVVRESGNLEAGGNVTQLRWSPDGRWIAYTADELADERFELFVVGPAGAAPSRRVSREMISGGDLLDLPYWSPDSTLVAYLADQDVDQQSELYVSTPDASYNMRVSGQMVSGGDVFIGESVQWASDSSRIAYLANQNATSVFQLFTSTPAGAASNVVVSGPLAPGGSVLSQWVWSRDDSRLIYLADQDQATVVELFATSPDSEPASRQENPKLSGTLITNGSGATVGDVSLLTLQDSLRARVSEDPR